MNPRPLGTLAASLMPLLFAACASAPKPLMWKISKGERASWLLGTIHVGVPASDLSPSVLQNLRASGAYIGELDVRPDPKSAPSLELSHSVPGLDELLSPESWAALKVRLKGVPEDRLKRMNPFFAMYLLDDVERRESGGKKTEKSASEKWQAPNMDDALIGEARQRGMVISFLEEKTPTLRACVERSVARDLDERLKAKKSDVSPQPTATIRAEPSDVDRVAAAYRRGDLRALSEIEAEEETEANNSGDCSIAVRNRAWAEKIERLHGVYAPAFIAVGVGHAVTRKGSLLDLLKERGFSVERAAN